MRPWQHAFASLARQSNTIALDQGEPDWRDLLPLHEFLDLSKAGCADRRHRIMLHHCDMGSAIAERAFPGRGDCAALVRQHVEEDLGFAATLSDWLAGLNYDELPRPVLRRVEQGPDAVSGLVINRVIGAKPLDAETRRFQEDAAREVARFLWMPLEFESRASVAVLSVLMNSVGPALVRRVFGAPQIRTHRGQSLAVDYAWMAEAVIMACFGRIPDLAEIVRCVEAEPGFVAAAS
jgi:hypothetical protein